MMNKLAYDIAYMANIKLAALDELLEKSAANTFGITPQNFNIFAIGNPEVQQTMVKNIAGGKVALPIVQNLQRMLNHPSNGALRTSAQKSGLTTAVGNFLQGLRPPTAEGLAKRQQFNSQNLARVLRRA